MDNINFRGIPTSLFLNGPKLGIVTDPQSQTDVIGVATFTGITTASFPNPTDGVNDGSIEFKWYFDGSQILDTSVDSNSNASIVGFSSATGTGSTITINGLTTDDSNKEVYFTADYIPSAYSQPAGSVVTAGTARSTGNAFNEPLQSGIGTITVFPVIEITSQPTDVVVGKTFEAEYSIAAKTTPGDVPVNYQWQLDGNDLSDGTNTTSIINESATGQITITNDTNNTVETIDFSQVSSYDSFAAGVTYNLTANADITTKVFAEGAGGGTSRGRSVSGGTGGSSEGTFTFVNGQTYKLNVGQAGTNAGPGGFSGGGNGGGGIGLGGGGGGFTGLFSDSITIGNSVIIAGGGGGGANDPAAGGAGGGLTGGAGGNGPGPRGGGGGTQSSGGSGGSGGGGALQGGPGAAGGGGGYYGGAGGNPYPVCCADGAGGGGSGYIGGVTDGTTTTGAGAAAAQDGSFRIELISTTKTVTTTIAGSQTDNLTISSDGEGAGVIRCKVTADNVQKSPVFSRSVSYYVVGIRNVIKIEQYNYTDGTAILSENNLSDGGLSLSYDTHPGNAVCLYAGEKDIDVEVDMYGGIGDQGAGIDAPGGEGGYSKIAFTMKKDEEYVLTGLFDLVNAPFLYRKGTLIAVVGEGGTGAKAGAHPGSDGGGIGISGSRTRRGTLGGQVVPEGQLSSNGYFGTMLFQDAAGNVNEEFRTGSEPLTHGGHTGGRTISCARGVYWRDQGKLPCEDLGTIKFRTPNGTEISNTAEIERGYKSGYNIIQTAGRGFQDKGTGGNGATGGDGGISLYHAGAGGSGYTDGSVTVVSTQQGGSTGPARINIKLSAGDFFIDSEGRILIFSTNDNRDPRTLTKTTGVVNYGDNTCIDDARWQNFLDLARDGTQDYRLAVTINNSTVKITNATTKNIHKMMNGNALTLRTSLTGWVDSNYAYTLLALAWDETSNDGMSGFGSDYSILSWSQTNQYGYGFYGSSSSPFFTPTVYGYKTGINFWILPPGVPDF